MIETTDRPPWLRGITDPAELRAAAGQERRPGGRGAEGQAGGYRSRADRPSRRRADEHGRAAAVRAPSRMELRQAGDSGLEFFGHATVYETPYEMWDFWGPYTEIVSAGAGAETLARPDLDVPLVLQHQDLRRIARTTNGSLTLTETEDGLEVLAPALDPADADVAYIAPKLRAGLVDEMSFKFRITSGQWSPDYMEYRIVAYDIHRGDVAIVGYGANPYTDSGLREQAPVGRGDTRARALLALALAR